MSAETVVGDMLTAVETAYLYLKTVWDRLPASTPQQRAAWDNMGVRLQAKFHALKAGGPLNDWIAEVKYLAGLAPPPADVAPTDATWRAAMDGLVATNAALQAAVLSAAGSQVSGLGSRKQVFYWLGVAAVAALLWKRLWK